MKALLALSLLLLTISPSHTSENPIDLRKVISAVSDYQDTEYYRAILVQGEEDADLYIFTHNEDYKLVQTAFAPGIAITGIGNSDAYLRRNDAGNLQLVSHNPAIGRHRWEQILTIVYRNEQFIVGGFTYSYYDTLAVDENGEVKTGDCDVNLLTGKGVKDGVNITTTLSAIPVGQWTIDTAPDECFET